jgi:anti-anti-sigma factor
MLGAARIGQMADRERVRRARSGDMKVNLEPRQGGVAVARMTGRLDFASAQAARGEFSDAITSGYPKLVIDLGKIEFVDSAGLGSLIGGMRRARQAGGDLRIANPNDQVKTLLSLTSLDQVLKVHPTIEEAVVGFSR